MKHVLVILMCGLLAFGCGDSGNPVEVREVDPAALGSGGPTSSGMSAAQRLGMGAGMPAAASPAASNEFTYGTPEGWTEQAPTQFRKINFQVGASGEADCYVSVAGGGVLMNVNRWRGQMGQPPLSEAEAEALPRKELLGEEAYVVDVEGAFAGMGGAPAKEGYRMVGLILPTDPQAVFVKMTGPKDVIAAEMDHFDTFCKSLTQGGAGAGTMSSAAPMASGGGAMQGDPHAGMAMPPGMGGMAAASPDFHWTAPDGWDAAASESSMRLVTFKAGNAECYVTVLSDMAGGVDANINMWRGSMGLPAATEEDMSKLEKIEMLGTEGVMLKAEGEYNGQPDQMLLGAITPLTGNTVFVKMTGPAGEVQAQEEAFKQFCKSLHPAAHE